MIPATDVYGNDITIQSIAELEIMSNAFHKSKTMATKRGGNPFMMRAVTHARRLATANGITSDEVNVMVRAFIAENPMRYYPTSKKLTYLAKVA
jgi:hypothetical protein